MTLEEVKQILAQVISICPLGYQRSLRAYHPEVINFINSNIKFFDDNLSFKTKIYCVLHDCCSSPPKCQKEGCTNDVPHEVDSVTKGFKKYCSIKCGNSDPAKLQRVADTCIRKYGVKNVYQSNEVKQKISQTKLERYGDQNWANPDKRDETVKKHIEEDPDYYAKIYQKKIQTNVENGHPPTWSNREKAKETWEKHKAEYPDAVEKKMQKCKMTKMKNHGDPYWSNPEKTKQTKLERYGDRNYNNIEKNKDTKMKNHNDPFFNNHAKYEQTCLTNYGEKTTFLVHDLMKDAKQPYQFDGHMFKSAPELAYYIFLKDHDVEFIYQPDHYFTYCCRDKEHRYYPDFLINETNEFHEIKGDQFFLDNDTSKRMINPFDRSQDDIYEAKHQCMLKNSIHIITSSEYEVFLDYVNDKYGKDFIKSFKNSNASKDEI